jgi:peroxiredoxin
MKSISVRLLLVISLHSFSLSLLAQKHFSLVVKLPPKINKEKVEVWLEDGKEDEKISTQPTAEGQLFLTGDYYSLYAAVTIQDTSANGFANTFFVQQKPAVITFHSSNSPDSPFKTFSLENVEDFREDRKKINDYCAAEIKKSTDYEIRYADKIFSDPDTAIRNYFFHVLEKDLMNKKLEYIVKNPNSYYSFYSLRTIAGHGILSADSLLAAFNGFPDMFKYSDEGNYLHASIYGRLLKHNSYPVDFTTTDLNKTKITLSEFKGEKCVLLHFWATWCTPCIQELPAIKEISNLFKSKKIQIISVALPSSNYSDYLATIKRYRMDWIQIYNDTELFNKYGNQPTPRICLIDKAGKLVYDKIGFDKNDSQLSELKAIISEQVKQTSYKK